MENKDKTPLGYIELADGAKAVFPMNDIFLGFTFENPEYWEALRATANILIEAYKLIVPCTTVRTLTGKIKVRTRFKHLMKTDGKSSKEQDIKMTEDGGGSIYIEFQNRASTQPPIEIRSVEYFGLGISHGKGKLSNQIWLLAEDVESVLHGKTFSRYLLADEATGRKHPFESGIMYVSLQRLSRESGPAGELASFFVGKMASPTDEGVKKISEAFAGSFAAFKSDKEVYEMMSLAERYTNLGREEGREEGMEKGREIVASLKSGLTTEEISEKLNVPLAIVNEWKELISGNVA